jgi:hypothetical protein
LALFLFVNGRVYGQSAGLQQEYLCEIGLQAGVSYYVGDGAKHIFMNPREAYGVLFRYKFNKRWAIQAKLSGQQIAGDVYKEHMIKTDKMWSNRLHHADAMAEFNFFRFGSANRYDKRIRPYTPYIFLGIGTGIYGNDANNRPTFGHVAAYVPLGIGFKWKFHDCVGLNIAWQHNIYIADNLEGRESLDNKYQMNGWNWMNCDLTGMFTVGIVFEFARAPKPCRICNY